MPLPETERAQDLRRNATKEERHLWYDFLKSYPIPFHRQKPIGPYFVDFYCDKAKLVIELDGGQHYEDAGIEYDDKRTEYLNKVGLKVIRYTNHEVQQNFEGVCLDIDRIIKEGIPSSAPSGHLPPGEGMKKAPPEGSQR